MNKGRFGIHGGQFIPETLMNAVMDLEEAYNRYRQDPDFVAELDGLLREYAGRPSLLYYAEKMTRDLGGAKIYLKREDLNHTGSHKLNNAVSYTHLDVYKRQSQRHPVYRTFRPAVRRYPGFGGPELSHGQYAGDTDLLPQPAGAAGTGSNHGAAAHPLPGSLAYIGNHCPGGGAGTGHHHPHALFLLYLSLIHI